MVSQVENSSIWQIQYGQTIYWDGMVKPIIREAQIILILETCLMNNQKVRQKELYIISRYRKTENNLYVQHIENGGSWLNYFQNYERKILDVLDLNND